MLLPSACLHWCDTALFRLVKQLFLKQILLAGMSLAILSTAAAQESYKTLERKGDEFFKNGRFDKALDAYQAMESEKPESATLKRKMGISFYHTNAIAHSKTYLQEVLKLEKSPPSDVYLFLGLAYHATHDFKKAVVYYKRFLKNVDPDHPWRERVKDDIRRCAFGIRNPFVRSDVIVENLGYKVNSTGDDFGPVLSPNYDDRLYFSSAREGTLGGRRNNEGAIDEVNGNFNTDIFSTSIVNGEWSATAPLSYLLNSPRNDVILDFNSNGTRMYYFKGLTLYSGDILVDTFKRLEDRTLYAPEFSSPMLPDEGDISLYFYNDTILLFSSKRAGGFGGFDLYITTYTNGAWSSPENLGPTVNSRYDETAPFLARDGRTLYFSSNRSDRSMGGLDIFKCKYTDRTEQWSTPENLGRPFNSAGHDDHFRLSSDGMKGYFSSSRKDAFGMRDIYTAYYKKRQGEMLVTNNPVAFHQVPEYKKAMADKAAQATSAPAVIFSEEELRTYSFSPMHFNTETDLVQGENASILDKVVFLLNEFPQIRVQFTSHSDDTEAANFDLFFSIKRVENIARYMEAKGITPTRISLKGCGGQYPIAKNEINGRPNPVGQKLNRRVDIDFININHLPIRINYRVDKVSETMQARDGYYYKSAIKGLSYKVQIAAINQMYNGNLISEYPNATVETTANDPRYYYTVGLYQTYFSAQQLQMELQKSGVPGAVVVPYINGFRIRDTAMKKYAQAYPDLLNYLANEQDINRN